jgi:hypothetical protein
MKLWSSFDLNRRKKIGNLKEKIKLTIKNKCKISHEDKKNGLNR